MENTNTTNPNPSSRSHAWKVVLFIILLILIALILWWGFGRQNTVMAPKTAVGDWITYVCPSGKNVAARFSDSGDDVKLVLTDGQTLDLDRTRSAEGGRYANENASFVFWEKGSFAMITRASTTETCVNEKYQEQMEQNNDAIKETVKNFGKVLQDVSLLSPNASSTIQEKYEPYVTPELLHEWQKNPSSAPGRKTSSPWPDHIEIVKIMPGGIVYAVDAKVVLATSEEVVSGGNAGAIPVEMTMVNRNGKWLIASYMVKENESTSTSSSTETAS